MPGKAAKITITERQQEILQTFSRSVIAPSRLRQRTSIIVLAFDGLLNEDIAERVGPTHRQVGRCRRRWANAWNRLMDIECRESRAVLGRAIETVLTDEPRPGVPGKFTPEQVTRILAVACEPPEKSGRPISHWTAQELTEEVVRRGIVASISPSQVSRYLREAALQPHKSRSWLNITEKDPRRFEEQVVATDPKGSWVFVVDTLNIHCSESLVKLVADACELATDLGKKGRRGVLKSVASRQAFLSESSHRIRLVYLPKHSSWLNQIKVVFGVIMRQVIRRGSFTSVADLRMKLLTFIADFNRVFAKPFRWTYTGRPLMKAAA